MVFGVYGLDRKRTAISVWHRSVLSLLTVHSIRKGLDNDEQLAHFTATLSGSLAFCMLVLPSDAIGRRQKGMGSGEEWVEIESLERGLLLNNGSHEEAEDEALLYTASFDEMEENFVKYQTAQWILYSLLLALAWGIGLIMLLYLPVRRYILRKDIRSRKLYLTRNAIVYKVKRPVPFPCFGVLKKEKHVLLPSVADIVIEQGYLQSLFGVYSLRIENVGVRRPPSDDVQIIGIANPSAFRKAVLTHLSNMRSEDFSRKASTIEDVPTLKIGHSSAAWMSPSKSLRHDPFPHSGDLILLQKLEEVGASVKRVQTLIEEQPSNIILHRLRIQSES